MKKLLMLLSVLVLAACGDKEKQNSLTIYSGRKAKYAQELYDMFEKKTGIKIIVKEGSTAALANTIIKEGENSPADIFFAQDAGNLGALSAAGALDVLPESITKLIDERYRSAKGEWVGTSGRARVFVYNKEMVKAEDLPKSIADLADPKWKGKLGWAPNNASFKAHVTAMIKLQGKEKTLAWLKAMKANGVQDFPKNTPIVHASAEGKIAGGLVNHYYLHKEMKKLGADTKAANHFFADGDAGMFVNVSGVALMKNSQKKENALKFIEFLLSKEAQSYFKEKNFEYPLAAGVEAAAALKPLKDINPVKIDLGDLDKVEETKALLEEAGCL